MHCHIDPICVPSFRRLIADVSNSEFLLDHIVVIVFCILIGLPNSALDAVLHMTKWVGCIWKLSNRLFSGN